MRDSQGGGESYPAEGVRRRCMKNSPSVLCCIGKRTREGCDRGSEVETVHRKSSMTRRKVNCTNVSPPQRGGAVPAPLFEWRADMAGQLPRGARPSGRPQSSWYSPRRINTVFCCRIATWLQCSVLFAMLIAMLLSCCFHPGMCDEQLIMTSY